MFSFWLSGSSFLDDRDDGFPVEAFFALAGVITFESSDEALTVVLLAFGPLAPAALEVVEPHLMVVQGLDSTFGSVELFITFMVVTLTAYAELGALHSSTETAAVELEATSLLAIAILLFVFVLLVIKGCWMGMIMKDLVRLTILMEGVSFVMRITKVVNNMLT